MNAMHTRQPRASSLDFTYCPSFHLYESHFMKVLARSRVDKKIGLRGFISKLVVLKARSNHDGRIEVIYYDDNLEKIDEEVFFIS